jgi:hypothetical protein
MATNDELVEANALGEQRHRDLLHQRLRIGKQPGRRDVGGGDLHADVVRLDMLAAGDDGVAGCLGVVVAVAVGTSSRASALRQTVEHLVRELESRSSFAPQATGSMLVMVATMESSNAVVAEVGGAEGADAEGKASSFFILPSSESKCASSESNRLEILESSSSRSRVTSASMAVVGGDTIREGKFRGKIPRIGVSDTKC